MNQIKKVCKKYDHEIMFFAVLLAGLSAFMAIDHFYSQESIVAHWQNSQAYFAIRLVR